MVLFFRVAVLILMLAGSVFASPALLAGQSPSFFENMSDVPVMPGMVEVADQGYVFDKPQGRIGEAFAYGQGVSPVSVRAYYIESLPQFGWAHVSDLSFRRGGEVMVLSIENAENQEGGQVLTIRIAPE